MDQYLKSHHFENLEPSRTHGAYGIEPEIFLKLGYVYTTSRKIYIKESASALMEDWEEKGLDCLVFAETSPVSDAYETEILELTKFKDSIRMDHLVTKGFHTRIPGSVENSLAHENEDIIAEARNMIDTALQSLDKHGLAVPIKGINIFEWRGASLTRLGIETAQKIKEQAHLDFLKSQEIEAGRQMRIKCPSCSEVLLQTTPFFRSDQPVTGKMIEAIPNISQAGWSFTFGRDDSGESIQCLNCGSPLVDHDLFRFKPGVLVDPPEEVEEPDPVETINDFVLWKCAQGPGQKIPAGKLYEAYLTFCNTKEVEAVTQKSFGMALSNFGFKPDQDNKTRFWTGLGLLNP